MLQENYKMTYVKDYEKVFFLFGKMAAPMCAL
jgi:hypothetical protein